MLVKIEDRGSRGRGFFSSLNLTLLALLWCELNHYEILIGKSVLKLYSHSWHHHFLKRRPFSQFFGSAFESVDVGIDSTKAKTVFLDDIWTRYRSDLLWDSLDTIQRLSSINKILLSTMPSDIRNFITEVPRNWPNTYSHAIHFRGCDYLHNVPDQHKPNLAPLEFSNQAVRAASPFTNLFIATDDITFLRTPVACKENVYCFRDNIRSVPGRSVHKKTLIQSLGLEKSDHPFLRGVQALRDCHHLSKAELYIGSNSNMLYYSRVLNPSLAYIIL